METLLDLDRWLSAHADDHDAMLDRDTGPGVRSMTTCDLCAQPAPGGIPRRQCTWCGWRPGMPTAYPAVCAAQGLPTEVLCRCGESLECTTAPMACPSCGWSECDGLTNDDRAERAADMGEGDWWDVGNPPHVDTLRSGT